ncbi:MAG: hypothetical protein LLF28_02000 [Nitrospiraceae bacterium]|nr:hypothetical protein [Nitrospiraceae bacterium]
MTKTKIELKDIPNQKALLRRISVFSVFIIVIYILLLLSGQFCCDNSAGYVTIVLFLLLAMAVILTGCELFANGIEHVGRKLELSHATSGSILAAVGTALPETLLPALALIFGQKGHAESIAVGAILGAPFMLCTLAFFMVGTVSLILWFLKKRKHPVVHTNISSLKTELIFFIAVMTGVLMISLLNSSLINHIGAISLLMVYAFFVKVSFSHSAEEGEEYSEHFHFSFIMACPASRIWITIQTLIGLGLIVVGAHIFVNYLTVLSIKSGISSLVLSLLLAPVATELPEKFNSITWTIKRKDTLAISNITGAMVFQSTIPVSIGLMFTEWKLGSTELLNIILSLTVAAAILLVVNTMKRLPSWVLMCCGLIYLMYIIRVFFLN